MQFPEDAEFVCVETWNEALYRQALEWVDETRRAAFLSEEERESGDPRVKIYSISSPLQKEGILKQIAWSAVQRKMDVMGGEDFQRELKYCHLAADLILSEAADCWTGPMKNGRRNSQPYRRGMDLKGIFSGIPAILIGAGPSLEKSGHLLRQFEKKALLFAGGSALNAIDVEPHFAASIDAEAPYRQFKTHPFFETPFCYQSRMSAENFSLVHGERILFPDSSCSALNWIYEEEELFNSGWTVGNFLMAIASHMGCSPLILVGMDFCYLQDRKYAQKVFANSEGLISIGDLVTQRDWLMAAGWTEEFAKGREILRTTEAGLLSFLPFVALETILEQCVEQGDLRKRVHEALQRLPLQAAAKRLPEWDLSLERFRRTHSEEETAYQKLLGPLWQIWKAVFERETDQELALHKALFFQRVVEEHGAFTVS